MKIKGFVILFLTMAGKAGAQTILKGQVYAPYDYGVALDKVAIKSSAGSTRFARPSGAYQIPVKRGDTVRYYYQQRLIDAYIYSTNAAAPVYNVTINLNGPGANAHELETVKVYGKNYTSDSLSRRDFYKELYNYKEPKLSMGDNRLVREVSFMGEKMQINNFDEKFSLLDIQSLISPVWHACVIV